MSFTPAERRYNRRAVWLSLAYALLLIASLYWLKHHVGVRSPLAWVIAVLPALPLVGLFLSIGRYFVEERDEYRRMLTVRQSLIATAIALSAATIYGFLQSADLAPAVDGYWVAVTWFFGQGVGACVNKLIERGSEA